MEKFELKTPSFRGEIVIGEGAAAERLPALVKGQKNFVLTDSRVYALYPGFFAEYFGRDSLFVLPEGEKSKTFENLGKILRAMTEAGLHRTSRLFAVGGGVIGDIGGLAAALYMRGISCVQVPTTLLAQVDSGVGGKTAVDLAGVKNVVGAFFQPCEVVVDPMFLRTLSPREIKCGLGEMVKYAALDREIFRTLKENRDRLTDLSFLSSLILPCVQHKAKVVAADERETGERKSLNVGHTTGHAVELASGLSHGECVLWGMLLETQLAGKYGVTDSAYAAELCSLVRDALRAQPVSRLNFAALDGFAEKARSDKKNEEDGNICMAVAKSEGKWTLFSLPFAQYRAGMEAIIAKIGEQFPL